MISMNADPCCMQENVFTEWIIIQSSWGLCCLWSKLMPYVVKLDALTSLIPLSLPKDASEIYNSNSNNKSTNNSNKSKQISEGN